MSGSDHGPDGQGQHGRFNYDQRRRLHAAQQHAVARRLEADGFEPILEMSRPDPGARPRAARDLRWEVTMNIKLSARSLTAALFATVLIGGLCGRAGAATAISTCGTLSSAGNYYLTSNLTATGDCLVIAAANGAIDMK